MVDFVLPKSVSSSTFVVNWKPPKGMVDFYKYTVKRTTGEVFLKNTTTRTSFTAGPVSSRFNRFYQIGPRTLKGPRASGGPFLYCEVQNTTEDVK